MHRTLFTAACLAAPLTILALPGHAQEVCYTDATKKFDAWRGENGKTLSDLSAKFEASQDPYKEMIDYNGMRMPLAAALIIEGEAYGQKADVEVNSVVGDAQKCAGETNTVRGVYDFARSVLGWTTVLPERATRIDFEELRRGKIAGGKDSIINEAGRKIDETLNPFRWKF